ncbi:MAG TPA: LytR family transcriptional regulator [Candidatus Marinimicrobia bacterium]|nr:LytR family transcriptional regulator [Candidatus Neomarinimicrobiota bacterium]
MSKRKPVSANRISLVLNGIISILAVVVLLFVYSFFETAKREETRQIVYSGSIEDIPVALLEGQEKAKKQVNMVVQILNGCGAKGIANEMKSYLTGLGIDVRSTGNADNFGYTKSKVLIHHDQYSQADQFVKLIGGLMIPEYRKLMPGQEYDYTLILGEDFLDLQPFAATNLSANIEILNGCGASGLSHRFQQYMSANGYEVKSVGNAEHFDYPRTKIIVHNRLNRKAVSLSEKLGVAAADVQYSDEFGNNKIDVTLILGNDYFHLTPYKNLEIR